MEYIRKFGSGEAKMEKCKVKGCENNFFAKGFCAKHYMDNRKYGQDMKKCKVEGCENNIYALGYCHNHYSLYRRNKAPIYKNIYKNKVCRIKGCEKPARTRGYCPTHYTRWRLHGTPYYSAPASRFKKGKDNINWAGGVCEYYNHAEFKKQRLIRLEMSGGICEICKEREAVWVLHFNKNKQDHRIANLRACCMACHNKHYKDLKGRHIKFDFSLEQIGLFSGVSQTTVDKYLSGGGNVEETREKIVESVRLMNELY